MDVKLQSSELQVGINYFGAEICSVKNNSGLEFIWQGDKTIWARHAPVLFPIVGKLKNNKYFFNKEEYDLPQHGFARDIKFNLISQSESNCTFQLTSNNETKIKFPFDFVFEINYELKNSSLITNYKVKNLSQAKMFFSLGAHPGFNCPLLPVESFEDYFLKFENSTFNITSLSDGLRTNEKIKLSISGNKLLLDQEMFNNDALVFENNQINKISLCSTLSNHKITMECESWPYFGIWGKKENQQFICLEPWYGVADNQNTNQMIEGKDGILNLNYNEEFRCSFSMSFL